MLTIPQNRENITTKTSYWMADLSNLLAAKCSIHKVDKFYSAEESLPLNCKIIISEGSSES